MAQTVEDLGKLVKQKYPASKQYQSMSDIDLGNLVKQKYPSVPAYQAFADIGGVTDLRTPVQVGFDQSKSVLTGIPKAVTGIPGAIAGVGGLLLSSALGDRKAVEGGLTDIAKSITQPFTTTARGIGALVSPDKVTAPSQEEWTQAAEGAGTNLGGLLLPKVVSKVKPLVKSEKLANKLKKDADVNAAKSLRPSTLEDRAITLKIAPEMVERGLTGTGKQIDKGIETGLSKATIQLEKETARLKADPRPEMQVHRDSALVAPIEQAMNGLKVKGTDIIVSEQALGNLERIRSYFKSLPEYIDFDQLLDLRQKLDRAIDDMGGFRNASSAADRLTMKSLRGGADIARKALNSLDENYAKANKDWAYYRHAMDIVERRNLGEVGTTGSGLPGRGNLLDDILATWAGEAMAGPVGGATAEIVNLARQTRGYASLKAATKEGISKQLRPETAAQKLLGRGSLITPSDDASGVTGVSANKQPLLLDEGEGVRLRARRIPKPDKQGPFEMKAPIKGLLPEPSPKLLPSPRGKGPGEPTGEKIKAGTPTSIREMLARSSGKGEPVPMTGTPSKGMEFADVLLDPKTRRPVKWIYRNASGKEFIFDKPKLSDTGRGK